MNLKFKIFLLLVVTSSVGGQTSRCHGYKTVIDVVANISNCVQYSKASNHWKCPSLHQALNVNPILVDTCINITKNHFLTEFVHVHGAQKLKITSGKVFTFQCEDGHSTGLSFTNGNNIELQNLKFNGPCGGVKESVYIYHQPESRSKSEHLKRVNITGVLHFHNVTDITLNNIEMDCYRGYGISMTDSVGNILVTKSTLKNNRPVYFEFEHSSKTTYYGGGILFRQLSQITSNKGAHLTVQNSILNQLRAYPNKSAIEKESMPYKPFGYGGAISVSFYRTSGNKVTIIGDATRIKSNIALNGGAIFVEHSIESFDNTVLIKEIYCTYNTAVFSGGAIFYYTEDYPYKNNNSFVLNNLYQLDFNTALNGFGGAFYQQKQRNVKEPPTKFDPYFIKTVFYGGRSINHNNAKLGSALFFDTAYVQFDVNVNLGDNDFSPHGNESLGYGAIYAYQSHLLVTNDGLYVYNNHATGIVLDFSFIHVRGKLELDTNKGIEGGGMALRGQSQILIESTDASLDVHDNVAYNGGGIFVEFNGPFVGDWQSNLTPVYPCFFQFSQRLSDETTPRVKFENNNATLPDGSRYSDIFTTSLQPCSKTSKLLVFFQDQTEFNFISSNHSINTRPSRIYIPNDKVWKNMYPGKPSKVHIELYDETNQTVSSNIKMEIIQKHVAQEKYNYEDFIVSNNIIEFTLDIYKKPPAQFDLIFSVEKGAAKPEKKTANFSYCPFANSFHENSCRCDQKDNEERGIVACIGDQDVYIYANLWFKPTPEEIKDNQEKGIQCPNNYCRICNLTDEYEVYCKYNESNQCAPNRDPESPLCSSCKAGKVLQWGSEDCVDCHQSNGTIVWNIFLIWVMDFVVVMVLLLSNVYVYSCYLNSVFFFYQVIPNFLTTTQRPASVKPIIEILNFEGFGVKTFSNFLCFGKDFNNLTKPALANLLLLVTTFLNLLICIVICSKIRERLMRQSPAVVDEDQSSSKLKLLRKILASFRVLFMYVFQRENGYRATVFIILYSYGSLLKVCFDCLKFVQIGVTFRMYNYAEFQNTNLFYPYYYVIFTIILILLSMYPFVIERGIFRKIFCKKIATNRRQTTDASKKPLRKDPHETRQSIVKEKKKQCLRRMLKNIRKVIANRHVADVFKEPFRTDHCSQFFAVYYLLMRIIIDVISMFMVAFNPHKQLSLVVLTVVAVLILIIFTLKKPYKDQIDGENVYLNQFDTIILFLICAIGIVSNGKQKMSVLNASDTGSPDNVFAIVVLVLLWFPIILASLINCIRIVLFGLWACNKMKAEKVGHCEFLKNYIRGAYKKDFHGISFSKKI